MEYTTTDGVYTRATATVWRRQSRASLLRDLGPVIYFLRVGGLVKVGFTRDLAQRLPDYPPDTALLAWRTGATLADEQALHEQLSPHTAARREWYHPTPEVIALVNQARIDCGIAKYATPI